MLIHHVVRDLLGIERIGFLDIETTGLSADFGFMFSYAIKDANKNKIYGRRLRASEIKKHIFDSNLIEECVRDMRRFDRLVTFYGSRFDIPFLRTRALVNKKFFPEYDEKIWHTDMYYIAKHRLRMNRRRLQNVCDLLDIESKQHRLNPSIWHRANAGDKKALEYIWKHNKEDVVSTEKAYWKLCKYAKRYKRSI